MLHIIVFLSADNNIVSNGIQETLLVNEIHLTQISLPGSQDSSQGKESCGYLLHII